MTIGERIKNRRIQLGLTQTELAHKMGITSKTTICKAETTDFNPTMDRVREFADALSVSPAYLMGWSDSPSSDFTPKNTPHNAKKVKVVSLALKEYANDADKAANDNTYYLNEETAETAQSLFENDDMRLLFDAAKDSKPEDLKMAADLLKRLKSTNPDG